MRNGPLVVIGDALLDVDLDGTAGRLCPDAPVPSSIGHMSGDAPEARVWPHGSQPISPAWTSCSSLPSATTRPAVRSANSPASTPRSFPCP